MSGWSIDTPMEVQTTINGNIVYSLKTGLWKENSYCIHSQRANDVILIDPGDKSAEIIEFINNLNAKVHAVLLTHAHHDHVGAIDDISKKFSVPFYYHADDRKLLQRVALYAMSLEKG